MNNQDQLREIIDSAKSMSPGNLYAQNAMNRFHSEKADRLRSLYTRKSALSSLASLAIMAMLFFFIPDLSSIKEIEEYNFTGTGIEINNLTSSVYDMNIETEETQTISDLLAQEIANHVISEGDISSLISEYGLDESELLAEAETSGTELNF